MLQWMYRLKDLSRLKRAAFLIGALFAVGISFAGAMMIAPAHAQSVADRSSTLNQGVQIIQQPLGLPAYDIRVIIANIIRAALGLLGIICLVLMLYAGYLWMTSGGNEEQIGSAKRILTNAVIGLAIILSAYTIVLFVMRLLGVGGIGNGNGGLFPPGDSNLAGSGALGTVIEETYPTRNQVNVPRNTNIAITFFHPVVVTSTNNLGGFVEDTNGDGVFGDCTHTTSSDFAQFMTTYCDNLLPGTIVVTRSDTGQVVPAAVLTSSGRTDGKIDTVVIHPYTDLGSSTTTVSYTVTVNNTLRWDDPTNNNPLIFKGYPPGHNFYTWQFTCSTEDDFSPPYVTDVFPNQNGNEAKNSVIQISFNKPVDPTGVQGIFVTSTDGVSNYYATGNNVIGHNYIFLKSTNSSLPSGAWKLLNNYQTLEFTPNALCGENACGSPLYCLPVCDEFNAACGRDSKGDLQDKYEILLRAALTNGNGFQTFPNLYSGIKDMSGNALDGNGANLGVGAPTPHNVTSTLPIFGAPGTGTTAEQPDNFYWNFILSDTIDNSSPYLNQVAPGLDKEYISADEEWSMVFSKRMQITPLYSLGINIEPPASLPPDPEALCKEPLIAFIPDGTTYVKMDHCPFLGAGTNTPTSTAARFLYFPTVDSNVEDVHFNCFYPGLGPIGPGPASGGNDSVNGPPGVSSTGKSFICGTGADAAHCCAVTTSTASPQPYCCNGLPTGGVNFTSSSCVSDLHI